MLARPEVLAARDQDLCVGSNSVRVLARLVVLFVRD